MSVSTVPPRSTRRHGSAPESAVVVPLVGAFFVDLARRQKEAGADVLDLIRYFGSRKKIFNVHFRNIEGNFGNFRETYPDNGSVNMIEAVKTYQEVGYEYMLMPDHVDSHDSGVQKRAKPTTP